MRQGCRVYWAASLRLEIKTPSHGKRINLCLCTGSRQRVPARSASRGLQLSSELSQAHPTPAGCSRTALALGLYCSQLGTLPSACPRPAEGQRSTRGSQLRPLWCRARENVTDQPALLNGAGLGASARAWGGAGICTEQLEEAQGSDPSKSPLFHEIQAPAVPGLHLVPSLGIRGWLREMWPQAVPTALLRSGQSFQLFPHEGPGNPWMEVWLKLPWHRWRGSCVQRANPSCCCA